MKGFLIPLVGAVSLLAACTSEAVLRIDVTERVVSGDYLGNGVEWDPYDEAEAWGAEVSDADWAKLFERLDFMRPGYVRCMINSPYRYYDARTGRYDRTRNLASLRRLLQYCQDRGITVAYGEYNPPTWEMKDSQQWVEMSVDYLNFLVCDLGFDCIRYFIIFNEPDGNWASTNGDYGLWSSMLRRFDAELSRYPDLKRKVSFAAPDVVAGYRNPASEYDAAGWVSQSAREFDARIGIYDVHSYPGQYEVRSGSYAGKLRNIRAAVPAGKRLILGEAGYKYSAPEDSLLKAEYDRRVVGHPFTRGSDCNMLCYDYFYGLDMPLLAMEVMNNGLSGVAAWMLDDAMHSNGDSGRTEDVKIWGMWNILGEEVFGDASQEALRPWYYTWSLMCRYFPAGSEILACEAPQREGLRAVAARKEGAYSVAAVNFSSEPYDIEITLPEDFTGGMLYRYTEEDRACDERGLPVPCERNISGRTFRTTLPAESFVLLTNIPVGEIPGQADPRTTTGR